MESFEGKKGQPRLKPPFPAGVGLYGCPTTANNVDTIALVRASCGAARTGLPASARPSNTGTKLYRSSGHLNGPALSRTRPASAERAHRGDFGGVRGGWDNLIAVIPGGMSMPMIPAGPASATTLLMDFDGCRATTKIRARHRRRDRDG